MSRNRGISPYVVQAHLAQLKEEIAGLQRGEIPDACLAGLQALYVEAQDQFRRGRYNQANRWVKKIVDDFRYYTGQLIELESPAPSGEAVVLDLTPRAVRPWSQLRIALRSAAVTTISAALTLGFLFFRLWSLSTVQADHGFVEQWLIPIVGYFLFLLIAASVLAIVGVIGYGLVAIGKWVIKGEGD